MQRWKRVGCWMMFVVPFMVPAGVALYATLYWVPHEDVGLIAGLLLAAVVFGGLPLFVTWLRFRRRTAPPPARSVGPRPGDTVPPPRDARRREPGPVGSTGIEIVEWEPGRAIRLRQNRTWEPAALGLALAALFGAFVLVPSFEPGAPSVGVPEETFWLVLGGWVSVGLVWGALPTPAPDGLDRLGLGDGRDPLQVPDNAAPPADAHV